MTTGWPPPPAPPFSGAPSSGRHEQLMSSVDTVTGMSRPTRRPEEEAADVHLLGRIDAGDRYAVDELYQRYGRRAFALARRVLAEDSLAEDVVQEVFLSVWRNPAAFDQSRARVSTWLMAMVHHKAVDAVRREESQRRRQKRAEDEMLLSAPTQTQDVEDAAWQRVVSQRVQSALAALPLPQRHALTLAYYGGYTQREVAALTGAPLGTVKTRMLAGMRSLEKALDGESDRPGPSDDEDSTAPVDGTDR